MAQQALTPDRIRMEKRVRLIEGGRFAIIREDVRLAKIEIDDHERVFVAHGIDVVELNPPLLVEGSDAFARVRLFACNGFYLENFSKYVDADRPTAMRLFKGITARGRAAVRNALRAGSIRSRARIGDELVVQEVDWRIVLKLMYA